MAKREVWVGIDVSKRRLDVALGVHGELLQVDNDPGGFTVLLEKLGALGPELIVLEASGGYETALVGEFVDAKLPGGSQPAAGAGLCTRHRVPDAPTLDGARESQ